jgi:hypothetical protein
MTLPFAVKDEPASDSLLSGCALVSARGIEIENAYQLSQGFWRHLDGYFDKTCSLDLSANDCSSLYIDTRDLTLLIHAQRTLRDRPGGSSGDEVYEDQFGLKCRHPEFQHIANQIVRRLFPEKNLYRFSPYVRVEIERPHAHLRNVSEYRFPDLPPDIQSHIAEKLGWSACAEMVFAPQVLSIVDRHKYTIYLDPFKSTDFMLPASFAHEVKEKNAHYVCLEIGMDKCVYRQPTPGISVADIFEARKSSMAGVDRHRRDKWILEHEFKVEKSSPHLTDGMMIGTYMRFMMFLYEMAASFKGVEPIRTAGSKAARGYKSLFNKRGDFINCGLEKPWSRAP